GGAAERQERAGKWRGGWRSGGWKEAAPAAVQPMKRDPADHTLLHEGTSGIILAVNVGALIAEAERADCVIELAPQVGDFVAVDEPIFYLYGKIGELEEQRLRSLVALGSGRTMEQDPRSA